MKRASVLLALLAACAHPDSTAHSGVTVGDRVPSYAAATLTGGDVRIGEPADDITLLNVWATWCTSCREEMADLESLHRAYNARGVRVVAVSLDAGSNELVRRFVAREALTFTIVHDRDARLQSLFRVNGVPSTYVIDRTGRLLWQHTGGLHGAMGAAQAMIDSALASGVDQ
jgi:cytochrome c biogenesis protein CcmG, thiol:disulfide interchange protein DsbE